MHCPALTFFSRNQRRVLTTLAVVFSIVGTCRGDDAAGLELFEKKIRPVLIQSCYECHSSQEDKPKGGLRLDSREAARTGGDSGAAIVPGKPDESLLIEALRHESFEMPPQAKLSDETIADFVNGSKSGHPTPAIAPIAARSTMRGRYCSMRGAIGGRCNRSSDLRCRRSKRILRAEPLTVLFWQSLRMQELPRRNKRARERSSGGRV